MWLRSLLESLTSRSRRLRGRGPKARRRLRSPLLQMEMLEDRVVPSTYVVNRLTDTGAGSGLAGDLRYCITHATSGSDAITFGVTGTIDLKSALPALNVSVAIEGPGAGQLTVERSSPSTSLFGIFAVSSGATVQISGLTVTHSATTAITNAGTLTVSDCSVSGNTNYTYSSTGGGAFDNSGVLTVNNSTLSGNRDYAQNVDAICNTGTANVSNSTITTTFGSPTIYNSGTATLDDIALTYVIVNNHGTLIVGNSAFTSSVISNSDGDTTTISNCTFWDGDIDNLGKLIVSDSTFQYAPIDNGNSSGNNSSATIDDCTFSDTGAFYNGSASSATISDSTLAGNTDSAVLNYGNLTINNSTLSGNKSIGSGAQVTGTTNNYSFIPAGNGLGGGIYMGSGTLSINSSTIADNEAVGGFTSGGNGGSAGNGYGGGLYIAGGTVSIDHSTLAGNQAISGSAGAGASPGLGYGGAIDNEAGPGALQMRDTIIADNSADIGPDFNGGVTSLGHNLIGNSTGGSGFAASDLLNVNPQLGPLQNNGGPTQTMALLPGSPAIDAGDNTNAPAYDQRGPGFPRIVNGIIDIGAFEVQAAITNHLDSFSISGFPATITAGSTGTFTVTALNADGSTDSGYTGTVHFASSDSQAGLPTDYTFTSADAGVHAFSAILKTAGAQSLTVQDTAAGISKSQTGIVVNPAAASSFSVRGFPSPTTAGVAGGFTLTALDPFGNTVTSYTGTVYVTSSDSKAVLPANYTFQASDAGVHTFSATLKTAGTQSLTVKDTSAGFGGSDIGITVQPAGAARLAITTPARVVAGAPFSLTVMVLDAYGNLVTGYTGTVQFASTDGTATLPANYTFQPSDGGKHAFTGLVLRKKGEQTITVTDKGDSSVHGSAVIDVLSITKLRLLVFPGEGAVNPFDERNLAWF